MSTDAEDNAMLQAYQDGLVWVAERIKQMGGDPAKPTQEQAELVAQELLDRGMLLRSLLFPDAEPPTAEGIMRDHRKFERLRKRKQQ
jgi:hypothetical protein